MQIDEDNYQSHDFSSLMFIEQMRNKHKFREERFNQYKSESDSNYMRGKVNREIKYPCDENYIFSHLKVLGDFGVDDEFNHKMLDNKKRIEGKS